jgi:hypothetical protein
MHDLVVLGILFHFMRKIAYGHNKQAIIVLDDEPKFDYWFPQQVLRAMWHALSRKIRFLDTSQVETTGQQVLAVHISIRANATLSDFCPSACRSPYHCFCCKFYGTKRTQIKLATCVYPDSLDRTAPCLLSDWWSVCCLLPRTNDRDQGE